MAKFNSTQRALSKRQGMLFARLVDFNFSPDPLYLWEGFGPVVIDGKTYMGAGEVGSISDIAYGTDDDAGKIEFELSGVSAEVIALVREAGPLRGATCFVWGQFFGEDLQPADAKFWLGSGTTDLISYHAVGESGLYTAKLTVEGDFADRNGAAYAYFSDRDQNGRFPGDRGLEFVTRMNNLKVTWP